MEQKRILKLNRFNYLTSGSEKHHLLDQSVKKLKFHLLYKCKADVKFLLDYEIKDSCDEKLVKLLGNKGTKE